MNAYNLIPLNQRSLEERRKIASMGGKESAKRRQERKAITDAIIRKIYEVDPDIEDYIIGRAMKKQYCQNCKYRKRFNKERTKSEQGKKGVL